MNATSPNHITDLKTHACTSLGVRERHNQHCRFSPIQVLAAFAFIAVCIALGTINNIDEDYQDFINEDEDRTGDVPETPDLVDNSRGACGWIIFLGIAAFFYEPLVILLRSLNVGLINSKINVFLAIVRQLHAHIYCCSVPLYLTQFLVL